MDTWTEPGRRTRGRQTEARKLWQLREHLQVLGGWNVLDVSGLARAAVGKVGPGHPGTTMRRSGSGRLAGIPQNAFFRTPRPLVFNMEWFHDQISSRNATRCATSPRLVTHSSTLKVLKIPAGKNLLDFI